MTEKQRRFVDEYVCCGNAAEAARRAGYSARTSAQLGHKLLCNVEIKAAINSRLEELHSAKLITQGELLEFLSMVVRGEYAEETATATGKLVRHAISTSQRIKASELLLKIFHAFDKPADTDDDNEIVIKIVEADAPE